MCLCVSILFIIYLFVHKILGILVSSEFSTYVFLVKLNVNHKISLILITFITSRLYLRTFCDIRLDTEHIKVTEGHQMNSVLTVSMHNYS